MPTFPTGYSTLTSPVAADKVLVDRTSTAETMALELGTLLSSLAGLVKLDEVSPSGTGVVTFSSLGQLAHLLIKYAARGTQAATFTAINMTFNGDTSAIYDRQWLSGNATVVTAPESLGQTSVGIGSITAASGTAGMVGAGTIEIYDYRGTTFHKRGISKSVLQHGTASGSMFIQEFGLGWRSTAAITSVTLTLASGNFEAGSKFSLYGLR